MLSGVTLALFATSIEAQEVAPRSAFFLHFDNDFVESTDRCYTGGLSLGWTSAEVSGKAAARIRRILPFDSPAGRAMWGLKLGQKVYTPDDISIADVVVNDRPYAGAFLLTGSALVDSPRRQGAMELSVGLVGPDALAEQTQSLVHRFTPSGEPLGWRHQLHDEPVVQLVLDERRRYLLAGDRRHIGIELLPHVSGGIGNLATFAAIGAEVRLGWRLPDDFGRALVRPSGFRGPSTFATEGVQFQLFAAADRKAIARDLLLDGNTFRSSHRVQREPFTSDISVGMALTLGRVALRYETVMWTRKFTTESRRQRYSSLLVGIARSSPR